MCWWCFESSEEATDSCPRCRRPLRSDPNQWPSAADPTAIERCPSCEGPFTRFDSNCPQCGRSLITQRRDFLDE